VILGDFNVDFSRRNTHTTTLTEFMRTNNLVAADIISPQNIYYTFSNHTGKHWIDHVLTNKIERIGEVQIVDDHNNHSDHRDIQFSFLIMQNETSDTIYSIDMIKRKRLEINWQNKDYTKRIEETLEAVEALANNHSNFTNKKEVVTKILLDISKTLTSSSAKAFFEIQNKTKTNKKRNRNRNRNLWSWWDQELEWLHFKLNEAYLSYKKLDWTSTERENYKQARKNFKARKRHNLKLKRDRTYKFIEELFSLNKVASGKESHGWREKT